MAQSMTSVWVARIIAIVLFIAAGLFFLPNIFKGCNDVPVTDSRTLRDSAEEKQIDSFRAANYELLKDKDSLEDLSEQKDRRLLILKEGYENSLLILQNKPAKVLYKEVQTRIPRSDTNSALEYCYDSTQQKEISKAFVENDYLKQSNEVLRQKDTICNKRIFTQEIIINNQASMLKLKDSQIIKLENKPAVVIKRKWYVDVGIGLGAFGLGYFFGNTRK